MDIFARCIHKTDNCWHPSYNWIILRFVPLLHASRVPSLVRNQRYHVPQVTRNEQSPKNEHKISTNYFGHAKRIFFVMFLRHYAVKGITSQMYFPSEQIAISCKMLPTLSLLGLSGVRNTFSCHNFLTSLQESCFLLRASFCLFHVPIHTIPADASVPLYKLSCQDVRICQKSGNRMDCISPIRYLSGQQRENEGFSPLKELGFYGGGIAEGEKWWRRVRKHLGSHQRKFLYILHLHPLSTSHEGVISVSWFKLHLGLIMKFIITPLFSLKKSMKLEYPSYIRM